ncbi:MAG TPA: sugar ABC transporter substrate-binding protein [Anaerovoracaceae bacterium]|nr:sugar ABC transporter substrate-binding protein [Anaerovoracaceae bacterium]
MKKKNMRTVLAVILALMMAFSLAACSGGSSDEQAAVGGSDASEAGDTTSGEPKTALLLVKNQTNPFFVEMADAVKALGESWGWTVDVKYPVTPDSNEEQIQILEQALVNPPDVFLVVPADSKGITPAIEKINEAGIPVVDINTRMYDESLDVLCYTGFENVDGSWMAVKEGAKVAANGGKNVIILEGVTGAQTSIDRTTGAKEAIEELGLTLTDIQPTDYNRVKAKEVMTSLLAAHPDIDLVFGASGEVALGAVEAIRAANRQDEITVVTINAYKELIEAIKDGRIALTVDDQSWRQGELGLEAAKIYFEQGKDAVEANYYCGGEVVDASNVDAFIAKKGW